MHNEANRKESISKTPAVPKLEDRGSKAKQSRLENSLPPSSLVNTNRDDTAVVFSSQKSKFAEYTTWKGIENKTGIEKEDATCFLAKELVDNALDYLESTTRTASSIQPEIHIMIEKSQGKYIRITVCNSSYQNNSVFSGNTVKSIFGFDRYHSSKRNQLKITKGALGDALKEVLCIPHILAYEGEITDWYYPLYIISQQKIYEIQLITDRINQLISSKIKETDIDFEIAATEIQHYHPGCTQVILTLPIVNDDNTYAKLYHFV